MLAAGLTIFLGAFLLFQVEPVLAKAILPWFGGAPAVWTTCMVFFQVALLAGYLYAHAIVRRVSPGSARRLHLGLVLLCLAVLLAPLTWGCRFCSSPRRVRCSRPGSRGRGPVHPSTVSMPPPTSGLFWRS